MQPNYTLTLGLPATIYLEDVKDVKLHIKILPALL